MSDETNLQNSSIAQRDIFGSKRRARDQQNEDAVAEAVRRTEVALQEIHSPPMGNAEVSNEEQIDPAPSVPAIAEERAQQLVTNISSQVLGNFVPCASSLISSCGT